MVGRPNRTVSVRSGENGEFTFANLSPAKYQLQVDQHGHSQLYEEDGAFSTAIVTGPVLDSEHILCYVQFAGEHCRFRS